MDNNLESIIGSLISSKKSTGALTELISEICSKSKEYSTSDEAFSNEASTRLSRKIEALEELTPRLSPKNAEQAKFIIRILTIAKFISELE